MAEYVFQNLEGMLPEFEDLERQGIFERNELRIIIKRRTELEYKLQRRVVEKEDFLKYLQYELNVDSLRRKRIKKLGLKSKQHTAAEIGINKRIHHIFQKALKKFGNDLKLWMQYIDFCKKMGSKTSLGKALGRLVQLHSQSPSVWIMAAKWEFEDNGSIENARVLMQKSLRLNPESKTLWLEYFRLELLHVDKIKKRRDIMSISVEEEEAEKIQCPELFLANKTASIVYNNAIEHFPDDVALRSEFLEIYRKFPETDGNQNDLYEGLMKDFPNDEAAFCIVARRSLDDLQVKISRGAEVADGEWRNAEKSCLELFNQGAAKFQTGNFWEAFLQTFLELMKQGSGNADQFARRLKIILELLKNADESKCATEQMFLAWSELLLNLDDEQGFVDILSKGVDSVSSSTLCERYLAVMSQISDWESLNGEFQKCLQKLESKDCVSIWQQWMTAAVQENSSDAIHVFEKSLSSSKSVAEMGRLRYLQWAYDAKGIKEFRKLYKRLTQIIPVTQDLVQLAIGFEEKQEISSKKRIRRLHEVAVDNFGKNSVDCWLEFIKFELKQTDTAIESVGRIYWKALKTLNSRIVGEFVDKYTLLNTGVSMEAI